MKPQDVIQLVLGIVVGAFVLRPDIAGIPSATQETTWPREVEFPLSKKNDESKSKASQLLCGARRSIDAPSLLMAVKLMPPRAGAFVGGRLPFSGKKSRQLPSKNLGISKKDEAKDKERETIMIATHHGCEVF